MCRLLRRRSAPPFGSTPQLSNARATDEPGHLSRYVLLLLFSILQLGAAATLAEAQAQQTSPGVNTPAAANGRSRAATVGLWIAGGAIALGAHEGGHLLFDLAFDADPGVRRVEFHGIPFFAITHRAGLSAPKEFTVSSAGFWVQHAGTEWLLTRRPRLRYERAPVAKGIVAFNVLASTAYAGAAFFRAGPPERDTRGMAASADVPEPWIGAVVLAPAAFDTWRYFRPDSRAAVWLSRGSKIVGGLLILRAASRETASNPAP